MRALAALLAILTVAAAPAHADEIAIALTEDIIEIDAGFSGIDVTLFGVVRTPAAGEDALAGYDVAAVVRGPPSTFRLRTQEKRGPIWSPGPGVEIAGEPGVRLTLSTRALADMARPDDIAALGLLPETQAVAARIVAPNRRARAFLDRAGRETLARAFIAEARRTGVISEGQARLEMRRGGLFALRLALPPTTPVGDYSVDMYLFRNRQLVARDQAFLRLRKTGVEAGIYDAAHKRPIAYGFACVLTSLLAGSLAAAAFRR